MIVQVARILGLLVSTFLAVEFAQLHCRDTERAKNFDSSREQRR